MSQSQSPAFAVALFRHAVSYHGQGTCHLVVVCAACTRCSRFMQPAFTGIPCCSFLHGMSPAASDRSPVYCQTIADLVGFCCWVAPLIESPVQQGGLTSISTHSSMLETHHLSMWFMRSLKMLPAFPFMHGASATARQLHGMCRELLTHLMNDLAL